MTEDTKQFDPSNKFYLGQDVVCVKATYDPNQKTTITPELVVGQVYKIRWLGIYNHYLDGEYLGIRVEGIDRGIDHKWGFDDCPFYASRFRPAVNDPLAMFRNMIVDPDGYKPAYGEGPLHPNGPLPDDEGAPRRKVKEEVE